MNRSEPSRSSSPVWLLRRTHFQLAPLMDLLLIIIFAQFLDVRETSKSQLETMQRQQQSLERERDLAKASADATAAERDRLMVDSRQSLALLSDWFDIEADKLTVAPTRGDRATREAIERAKELSQSRPDQVVRFLVGHAELLKRAEIWTVHAGDSGDIDMKAGDKTQTFRLESRTQAERSDEVAERLFAAYKQLPQPKGLVILLVSFDPQSVAGVYQPLIDAMPRTLERLRADSPESRFEYTVLGTTADPFASAPPGTPVPSEPLPENKVNSDA